MIFKNLFRKQKPQTDQTHLEAFVDAFPGEYCALDPSKKMTTYSNGFCKLLGAQSIARFEDIQNCLKPCDAAALEGLYARFLDRDEAFSVGVTTLAGAQVVLRVNKGKSPDTDHQLIVFWVEPLTLHPYKKPEKIDHQTTSNIAENTTETASSEDVSKYTQARDLLQMQTAMNSIPRPLWLRDQDHKLIWCNAAYSEFLDMPLDSILSDQKELTKPASPNAKNELGIHLPPGSELAKIATERGEAVETRAHSIHKGQRLLMKLSEIPLSPLDMTLGIAYNITREEELEQQLKRYEASNKDLLGQLRSAIAIFDGSQKLEFYNESFAQLWGLEDGWLNTHPSLGEIMEKLRETRRLPEQSDFRSFKKAWQSMFTDLIEPAEDMLFLPDGSTYRMLTVPHSLGGLMMNFDDVTSRLELESSYNTLIAVQRETLDNLAEGVAVYGGDGRLKLCNPSFLQLWHLNAEDIEGEPHIAQLVEKMKPFFKVEDWDERKKDMIDHALQRQIVEGRIKRINKTLLEYITVPLPDGGVLISYSDITDKIKIENALREKNLALEAAERLKVDFLANVSYQLRTPLNAIMGFTEILDQEYFGPLNTKQKEYTHDMKKASNRLVTLINDILDLSTLEAGYMTLNRDTMKVYDMIAGITELMEDWARKEKIEIEVKCPKNIGTISADEKRIKQALVNIIRNSITFTPAGGKITLTASRKKQGLTLTVHDTGIGITEEDRVRIFEPFERAQNGAVSPRLARSGAGLGLSLVKNIVGLHNGTVELESEPDKGTKITMVIPYISVKTDLRLPVGIGNKK